MDDYIIALTEVVQKAYSDYKRAVKDYLDSSQINGDGELVYSVSRAALVHDKKEIFEHEYLKLKRAKLYYVIPEDDMEPFDPIKFHSMEV